MISGPGPPTSSYSGRDPAELNEVRGNTFADSRYLT